MQIMNMTFNNLGQSFFTVGIFIAGICGGSLASTVIAKQIYGSDYHNEITYWKLNGLLSFVVGCASLFLTRKYTMRL